MGCGGRCALLWVVLDRLDLKRRRDKGLEGRSELPPVLFPPG
jgi:hypothetical protein